MQRTLALLILILLVTLIQAEVVDRIVARVGNDIILSSDLNKQINQMKSANLFTEGTTEQDVLNQMIESRLIIQKARDLNYTVDENEIKTKADSQIKKIKARFATEDEYRNELRQLKLTQSDLQKYFIDTLTEQALTQMFYQKQIAINVNVADKEMRDFYLAHKDTLAVKPITWEIGMIMRPIEASPETDKAALDAIRSIQEKLKAGVKFDDLACSDSQCPSSDKGGDLGFITRGMMVKPFEDAAFALKVGEVSDVVKTQYGYHLIKLEEKRGDEIRVRHILKLVQPSQADSLAARSQMESIRQQYQAGKTWAELAAGWSMDKDTAKTGGVIGEFSDKDFPELFAPVLKSLAVGQVSQVLENEGVLYLFAKLTEQPSRQLSYDEVRDQIREIITRMNQMKIYANWITQLKKENFVEVML